LATTNEWFFAGLIYIVIVGAVGGFLPDDLFTTPTNIVEDVDELQGETSTEIEFGVGAFVGNPTKQIGFIIKSLKFFFTTFLIPGIPPSIGWIVAGINIIIFSIGVTWIVNTIRGGN